MSSFMKISQTVFNSQSRHEYIINVQRAITIKVGNPELWFMRFALLYVYVMFHENISNGFQLIERTRVQSRNGYIQCSKSSNPKSWKSRAMVHVFCTLSHNTLH